MKIATLISSVVFVSSTDPIDDDSFVLFPDLILDDTTAAPAVETPSSAPAHHWCGEYDRIRFLLDSTTVGVNTWDRHVELLRVTIHSILSYINRELLPPSMPRLGVEDIYKLAHAKKINETRVGLLDGFLSEMRDPHYTMSHIGEQQVRLMFRKIVDNSRRMSRPQLVTLLARLSVELGYICRKSLTSLNELIARKKELIEEIISHKSEIESCFRDLGDAAQRLVDVFVHKQKRIEEIRGRFEPIRKVIVDAIERESVSPSLVRVPAEFKIKCVASAKSIIFAKERSIAAMIPALPQKLKRSLQQKGWNFLITWLQGLDDLESIVRNNFAVSSSKNERAIEDYETLVLTAEASLKKLEEDCSAGTPPVAPA